MGFDLDMTLIDARPGMAAQVDAIAAATGLPLDGRTFVAELGPPLEDKFREFDVPEDRVAELVTRFRATYADVVVPSTVALPGAAAALAAVHRAGGRTLVITGKHQPNALLHLAALDWAVDEVVGGLWASAKSAALREHGAGVYVGDHTGDMIGALGAGAVAVGVTTGPCTADQLRAAGASVVLDSLAEFPEWLSAQ